MYKEALEGIANDLAYWCEVAKNESSQDTPERWLTRAKQILSRKGKGWSIGVFKENGELPENKKPDPNDLEDVVGYATYASAIHDMLNDNYKQLIKEK